MTGEVTRSAKTGTDVILNEIECRGWILLVGAFFSSWGLFGFPAAGGVGLGGVLGLANFRLIRLYFTRVLGRGRRPPWWMNAAYLAKFGVIAGILVAAFRFLELHPLGAIAGFSVFIVAIVWAGLISFKGGEGKVPPRLARRMRAQE
jgi:hypothetical protein